jgi:hypothetical protein
VFSTPDQEDEVVPGNHVVLEQLCGLCFKGRVLLRIEVLELEVSQWVFTTVFYERSPLSSRESPQGM